jgi:hypothetical protein
MIIHQNPGQDFGSGDLNQMTNSRKEIISVLIILKNLKALYPPYHDVVKSPRTVQSGLSRHRKILS